jgi:hypothetical protein
MKKLVSRRQRVLRARHVQHSQAVVETMRARDEADAIASNARRLAKVRDELFRSQPMTDGATFAAHRELAARLESAGRQLDGALYDARRRIDEKEARRVVAHREREIAERLRDKAHQAHEDWMERRIAALPRYRRMQKGTAE